MFQFQLKKKKRILIDIPVIFQKKKSRQEKKDYILESQSDIPQSFNPLENCCSIQKATVPFNTIITRTFYLLKEPPNYTAP